MPVEGVKINRGAVGSLKNPMFWGCSKMFRCKARKKPNREAYMNYTLSGAVLQRNTADERFSTAPLSLIKG